MDISKDTWTVIDSYFRDTKHNLVRHHIDSFNDFIHNKIKDVLVPIMVRLILDQIIWNLIN